MRRQLERAADPLRPYWREPWTPLGLLIAIQWLAVGIFTTQARHNGWLFYQGGDESFFYTGSWLMAQGHLPVTIISYAWSMATLPIAALAGPSFLDALPALLILQVGVLLPLGLVLVYLVASRVAGRAFGYLAAAGWVFGPYIAVPLFVDRYHETLVSQVLPQMLGLTALGDFPSMVVLLVCAWFVLRTLDGGSWENAAAAGLAAGLAIGMKPSTAIFLAAPVVCFALARRVTAAAAFGLAMIPNLIALTIWKQRGLGELPVLGALDAPPDFGTLASISLPVAVDTDRYVRLDWDHLKLMFEQTREFFWSWRLLEVLPFAGVIGLARISWLKATFVGIWFASFLIIKGTSRVASVDSNSFWRLIMPAWPAFIMLVAGVILLVPVYGPQLAARFRVGPPASGRPSRRAVVIAAVITGVVPLIAVSSLRPLSEPDALRFNKENLMVPVTDEFELEAVVAGEAEPRVLLSWSRVGGGGAQVFYRVYRARPGREVVWDRRHLPSRFDGSRCVPDTGGSLDCLMGMRIAGYTRHTRFVDDPPPGRWVYRIGEVADYSGRGGDTGVLSTPATVVVGRGS